MTTPAQVPDRSNRSNRPDTPTRKRVSPAAQPGGAVGPDTFQPEAIPSKKKGRYGTQNLVVLALQVAGWAALLVWALVVPPFAPSMDGKRAACVLEVIADAALPYALGLWWLRRRYAVLSPAATGAVLGLAAGAAPAILMQLACVYEGGHGLRFHLGPLLACAIAGAAIAAWTTSRR